MVEPINPSILRRMAGSSGAIKDLIRFPRSPIDFPLHVVTARVDELLEAGLSESVARCVASGVAEDPHLAAAAAIGESWERIAFVQQCEMLENVPAIQPETSLQKSMLFGLPFLLNRGIDRSQWALESTASPCKLRSYKEFFLDRKPEIVDLPAVVSNPAAPSSLFETTNGLACADSYQVALDRAVREVVERDALMLVWLTKCGGRRVAPECYLTPGQSSQISRLSNMGIQTRLRNISTEFGISVFIFIAFAPFPGKRFGVAFGAGAHRIPELAARHAFREAGLSWRGVAWRALLGENPEKTKGVPGSFAEHAEFYSSWERMHLLDFLLVDDRIDSGIRASFSPAASSNHDDGHVELLLQNGRRVLASDITPWQAADTGLVVVQALVPGLVPLYIADRCADEIAQARLPVKIGGVPRKCSLQLNTGTHPWP